MNKFFYSTLFYSLLTCGSTSDLTLWTLLHPQPPELFQILRPTHFPLRPPPHARPPPLSTNRHPQVLLKSFLTTSAFQIVLSGEYLNCLTHLGVLIHFFWCILDHLSILSILKNSWGVWVFELSWPTSAFFLILLVCCESPTTSVFRAFSSS